MAITKRTTKAKLMSEMKKAGIKMPHGYKIAKRKVTPKKK
jgi:hypothetical protein